MQAQSNCVVCGRSLPARTGRGRPRKYCDDCKAAAYRRTKAAWRERQPKKPKRVASPCHCGRPATARGLCTTHYTQWQFSRPGYAEQQNANRRRRYSPEQERERNRKRGKIRRLPVLVERTTVNVLHYPGRSRPAQRRFFAGYCRWCGESFITTHSLTRFCCQRHAQYQHKNGVDPELAQQVYNRDGYVCQLCGEPTAKDAHYNDDQAPTVDHILPKSVERIDELWNLRTAHRCCNTERGDNFDGQLALAA